MKTIQLLHTCWLVRISFPLYSIYLQYYTRFLVGAVVAFAPEEAAE